MDPIFLARLNYNNCCDSYIFDQREMKLLRDVVPPPGFCFMGFRFNRSVISFLQSIPGARWDAASEMWLVPIELQSEALRYAQSQRVTTSFVFAKPGNLDALERADPRLYQFQRAIVARAIYDRRLLVAVETGLGKTPIALETFRLAGCRRVLVVTQKGILSHWADELRKWDPNNEITEVEITTYDKLDDVRNNGLPPYDGVAFDEVHNAKNYRTERYRNAKAILGSQVTENAIVLALSATPIDKPEEIHGVVDLVWPKRFGHWGTYGKDDKRRLGFRDTYCTTQTEYINGREIVRVEGINETKAQELRSRIHALSAHATKLEFGHLLPPFTVLPLRVSGDDRSQNMGVGGYGDDRKFEDSLASLSDLKLSHALAWVRERIGAGEKKLMLVTYRVELAERISKAINTASDIDVHSVYVIGETPDRDVVIKSAKAAPEIVFVGSMKSIGTGIDLTEFPNVLVVELYWSINQMKQLMGRFSRLSGSKSSKVELLTVRGTGDEIISARLCKKIDALNALLQGGQSDTRLVEALSEQDSDEDILKELRAAFATVAEGDNW